MNFKNETTKAGYNLEELYFERLNSELIRQIKAQGIESTGEPAPKNETLAEVIPFPTRTRTEKKAA